MPHTRRDFIQIMGLLTIGIPLSTFSSCSLLEKVTDPYEALLLLQKEIRKSSDYLPTRKAEAVASKDPKKIFAFVRDSIQTYPMAVSQHIRYEESVGFRSFNYRWGDKGCLRYGAGTFYEKAHLLKSMLHEAGFEAKLLYGPFDIDKTGWDKVFFYPYDLPFDADFPRAIQKETFRSRPIEAIKLDDQRVDQVFQNIKKSMPEDMRYVDPDWSKLVEFIDVVELEYEGQKVLLNPSIRDAEFGKSYIERVQGVSNKNQRRENIWVRLSLINSSEPHRPITFIENTFSPEQLFGNQLAIQFQSHLSTYDQLTLPRNRNQTFTPVMGLTGANIMAEEQQQFVKKGKTIRINGDTLEVKNNQLIVNDHPVLKGEEHPELRKQIRTLKGKVWPDAFPKIDLRFRADDKNDEMVNGLAGPDFDLLENGIPVPFECYPQKRDSQKVLLLFDFSGSVPKKFKDEQAVTFAKTLMESVQQQVPDAQFRAATLVGLIHYKLVLAPKWTKDISELEKQMVHIKGLWDHCSSIWNALADATQEADADLIVIVTDGDSAYDGNLTKKKKIVARGCPVVALGVGEDQNKDCLDEMAVLSSGIYRSVTEHQEAISFISTFANDLKFRPYHLSYFSADPDTKDKELTLSVKENEVEEIFRFVVPDRVSNINPGWIGIQLEIGYEHKSVRRKLAGIPTYSRNPIRNPVLPQYREETEAALFGNYTLCFEGTEPTTAILLDELIEAKLSQRKVMQAIQNGTGKETIEAIEKGFYSYPEDYFQMHHAFAPSNGDNFFCFQNGIRATLFSSYPNVKGTVIKAVDILPFSQWRTIHQDSKLSFEMSTRHSLQLMNLEAFNYPKATLNLIPQSTLDWLTRRAAEDWMRTVEGADIYGKWKTALHNSAHQVHLIPTDRQPVAFYDLDVNSGTVFAQLINGSGGGEQETRERFARLDRALTAFDQAFKRLGVGPAVGAWIGLEKKKLEYLMIATIAIYTMDAGQASDELNKTLKKHLCNQFEDAAANAAGGLGEIYKDVLDFVGVATGVSLSPCG